MECMFHLPMSPASLEDEDELQLDFVPSSKSESEDNINNLGMVVSTMGDKGAVIFVIVNISAIVMFIFAPSKCI